MMRRYSKLVCASAWWLGMWSLAVPSAAQESAPGGLPCSEGSPYQLLVSDTQSLDPAVLEAMICTFYSVYPAIVERFNPSAPTSVGMTFVPTLAVPAEASGANVVYDESWFAEFPNDTDIVVHESMHVVQNGYSGEQPLWIIEGMADYVRHIYGLHNAEAGWALPESPAPGTHYTDRYRVTAAFFVWIDDNYRQGQLPVADALDDVLRQGAYSSQTFVDLTGRDVDTLWAEYVAL